ncbi:uncharacterized protein LOC128306719 [Anopheles moucheti]|uniref:uncharacterized protein LOC128306719 n=1 Tax=Anopheles moucheti TaxID=186751 RepID=UPI0022EFDDE5|nr:uncharacterized protein LOC128306719 [Anopheles moucheti]
MIVGTFGGSVKPSVEEFLRPLVEEINELQKRGLQFGDKLLPFSLRAIIADSPMRATLKATMNYNGKHGCLKCTCVGTTIANSDSNKIIFDSVNADPRTDEGFRQRLDELHHKPWRTPLEDIDGFDMVEGIPVSDRLHLVDEGGTQKILAGILDDNFENVEHLFPRQKDAISAFIMKIRLPSEIPRRIRHLNEVPLWKATESATLRNTWATSQVYSNILWKKWLKELLDF